MNAAAESGASDSPRDERRKLFTELSQLREQRADLTRQLVECQRRVRECEQENLELRARLGDDQ